MWFLPDMHKAYEKKPTHIAYEHTSKLKCREIRAKLQQQQQQQNTDTNIFRFFYLFSFICICDCVYVCLSILRSGFVFHHFHFNSLLYSICVCKRNITAPWRQMFTFSLFLSLFPLYTQKIVYSERIYAVGIEPSWKIRY